MPVQVLATVISSHAALVANNLRISALAVFVYHYILTLPAEYRFYRAFYRDDFRLNTGLVQFVILRYTAVVTAALSNWTFFSHNFTPESCRRLFLLTPVFRVFLSMVSHAIFGLRAYTISRKNPTVGILLLSGYIFVTSLQWLSQIYHRVPVFVDGTCGAASLQPTLFLSSWLFYLTAMLYDLLTLTIAMAYLFKYYSSSPSASRLVKMMIYDGLMYFIALTVINAINAMLHRSNNSILQLAGAPLGSVATWIMSQGILIDLQNASEERVRTETPPHVHCSTRSLSANGALMPRDIDGRRSDQDTDRPSTGDHHVGKQEGTELVQVRVERSVVVGVGPWKAGPNEKFYRSKPEVKWDQGLV